MQVCGAWAAAAIRSPYVHLLAWLGGAGLLGGSMDWATLQAHQPSVGRWITV